VVQANGIRPRARVAGLEGFDELRSQLREVTAEAAALAAVNQELKARVTSLERQLADTAGLRDDELLAELPRRMRRALEAAQEVSEELVSRAEQREASIRETTEQRAAALMMRAERESTAMMRRAAAEAVERINDAKAQAEAMVEMARARRDRMMADLQQQRVALEDGVRALRREHHRLLRAYDVVEQNLGTARGALLAAIEVAGPPLPPATPVSNGSGRAVGPPAAQHETPGMEGSSSPVHRSV
jgi:chromosome segregation ATPase